MCKVYKCDDGIDGWDANKLTRASKKGDYYKCKKWLEDRGYHSQDNCPTIFKKNKNQYQHYYILEDE